MRYCRKPENVHSTGGRLMRYFREPYNVPSLGGRLIYNLQVEEKYDPVES